MAKRRTPVGITVNGASFLVKDPDASKGLFSKWQRAPGFSDFAMPNETGSTSETQLMDGPIQDSQAAGVGTITGDIGGYNSHATHRFLADKAQTQGTVLVTIIRPAQGLSSGTDVKMTTAAAADSSDFIGVVDPTPADIVTLVREAHLLALGNSSATFKGFLGFKESEGRTTKGPVAGDDSKFRSVLSVPSSGGTVNLEVGLKTAVAAGSGNKYVLRRPGILYASVSAKVTGFGYGEFSQGSLLTANLQLTPSDLVPVHQTEWRIASELGASGLTYSGDASSAGDYDGVFA